MGRGDDGFHTARKTAGEDAHRLGFTPLQNRRSHTLACGFALWTCGERELQRKTDDSRRM